MTAKSTTPPVRILPEELANKIAAGEVVERPASVVKELVENALDAAASRISVRIVAAGRRRIEVVDNGHGMSEQDALLSIERHATSKIRKAEDLDNITTMGFRGEALASIAAVSRFELITRRAKDEHGTRIRIDGGILRDVSQAAAPVGTRVIVNRLYFNTPVRAKFLKGITTELSRCIDVVQRHLLAQTSVGFDFAHNEKLLFEVPENARLRERVALIWGLNLVNEMIEVDGEQAGFRIRGLIGRPDLTRSSRSHQFFFLNRRPVVNPSLLHGFEDGFRGLLTISRHPVGVVMIDVHPRLVDVNIHPAKREIRFRDERAARDAIRDVVRECLAKMVREQQAAPPWPPRVLATPTVPAPPAPPRTERPVPENGDPAAPSELEDEVWSDNYAQTGSPFDADQAGGGVPERIVPEMDVQPELPDLEAEFMLEGVVPLPVYESWRGKSDAPMQLFDTYLLVPEENRLLIIDQHALHERLRYDDLRRDLEDQDYAAQQLVVPVLIDVPPSHVRLLETNLDLFRTLGVEIESFGGNTYQITAVCHLYDEGRIPDAVFRVLDELAQGELFDKEDFMASLLRLTLEACRGSVKAGDRLSPAERHELLEGFRRMRPPYTCPHGRPIITELTISQMEKSFRRRQ
jgi:DNA mismatch repair protein MutL